MSAATITTTMIQVFLIFMGLLFIFVPAMFAVANEDYTGVTALLNR
jgi:hypothetical protein